MKPAPNRETPWGYSDHATEHEPGVVFYSTPNHGGFWLDAAHNAKVPAYMRAATWEKNGERGWYEEDCDWAIVATVFPDLFPPESQEHARSTLFYWKRAAHDRWTQEKAA